MLGGVGAARAGGRFFGGRTGVVVFAPVLGRRCGHGFAGAARWPPGSCRARRAARAPCRRRAVPPSRRAAEPPCRASRPVASHCGRRFGDRTGVVAFAPVLGRRCGHGFAGAARLVARGPACPARGAVPPCRRAAVAPCRRAVPPSRAVPWRCAAVPCQSTRPLASWPMFGDRTGVVVLAPVLRRRCGLGFARAAPLVGRPSRPSRCAAPADLATSHCGRRFGDRTGVVVLAPVLGRRCGHGFAGAARLVARGPACPARGVPCRRAAVPPCAVPVDPVASHRGRRFGDRTGVVVFAPVLGRRCGHGFAGAALAARPCRRRVVPPSRRAAVASCRRRVVPPIASCRRAAPVDPAASHRDRRFGDRTGVAVFAPVRGRRCGRGFAGAARLAARPCPRAVPARRAAPVDPAASHRGPLWGPHRGCGARAGAGAPVRARLCRCGW